MQAATNAGVCPIIDLHNYGRWNSGVIGVDGPSNDVFARVWGLLATKYMNNRLCLVRTLASTVANFQSS